MALSDILESPAKAKVAAAEQARDRDAERARVRAKFSETDRAFIDEIRRVFPSARMVAVRFSDGEEIGGQV